MRYRLLFYVLLGTRCLFGQAAQNTNPDAAIELLSQIIKIKSHSGQEDSCVQILSEWAMQHGLIPELFIGPDSSLNLCISLYPLKLQKPNVILLNHLDVVPANEPQDWRHNPWSGERYGDTLWGRGTLDCKGLAVMQLMALTAFAENRLNNEPLAFNVTFLALAGEENSAPGGAAWFTATQLATLNPLVVYGEGGSGLNNLVPSKPDLEVFGISVAEKSSLWLELTARKKTHGHGAVPPDLYANKRLVKALINLLDQKREVKFSKISRQMFRELGKLEGGGKGFVIKHINWIIFWPFVKKYFREGEIFHVLVENTFVITEMATQQPGAANQIGKSAHAVLDCRLLPGTDTRRFVRRVELTTGFKVDVQVIAQSPNTLPSKTGPYFSALQAALKQVYPESVSYPILFPASTDNNFFRQAGIPTYGLIPAVLSREAIEAIHGPNEYVLKDQLLKGIETYKQLLIQISGIKP